MRYCTLFFLFFITLGSCVSKKNTLVKSTLLKPIKINTQHNDFRLNPDRNIDIIHTQLNVSFDWEKHLCLGNEEILFKPYYYALDSFALDAKNFIIHSTLIKNLAGEEIKHTTRYNDKMLSFYFDNKIQRADTLLLKINYTAQPDKNNTEGSKAISDDKGLYFINTAGKEPFKPKQIWTQGETESNSNWFVTMDKPFEKMTFEINITVPDSMKTLSNGLLIKSDVPSDDSKTRTDYWRTVEPMSAYLVMMAIGPFEKTLDTDYMGKEVSYYLEPKYHPHAKEIFQHTPEMIRFFSDKLGYPYPWQKYSQVVVHDFVSGAMENTSATLHGSFVQKNNRELIDNQNDGIVAHELFHHWFGDLITCASWSHLTLNEGFATFGEQLWFGYKYGKNAELKRIHEHMNSYLRYAKTNDEPAVRFHYNDKEEMFNAVIYKKGSRILNLLKFTLGEVAFFEGIKNYLHKYAFQTAQIEQLRFELEAVSGKDLRLFFKQWFHNGGHPVVDFNIDSTGLLSITQTQAGDAFQFPFQYRIGAQTHTLQCKEKVSSILLNRTADAFVYPDPNSIFIGEINNKTLTKENSADQFKQANNYIEKIRIIETITEHQKDKSMGGNEKKALFLAIDDNDPEISYAAMRSIDWDYEEDIKSKKEDFKRIANFSTHPNQKSQAIYLLSALEDDLLFSDFMKWSSDSSYLVAAAGLYAVKRLKPLEALRKAQLMDSDAEGMLFDQICEIYAEYADSNLTFFEENMMKRFGGDRNTLIENYQIWAARFGKEPQEKFWDMVSIRAKTDENKNVRFTAISALHEFAEKNKLVTTEMKEALQTILAEENDPSVRRRLVNKKILPKPVIE